MTIDALANLRTLRDVLRFAVTRFNEANLSYGHGQANAFEEAAFIILRALKLRRSVAARFRVTVSDEAGNKRTLTRTVKFKR